MCPSFVFYCSVQFMKWIMFSYVNAFFCSNTALMSITWYNTWCFGLRMRRLFELSGVVAWDQCSLNIKNFLVTIKFVAKIPI